MLGELLRGATQKGEQEKLVELRHVLNRSAIRAMRSGRWTAAC